MAIDTTLIARPGTLGGFPGGGFIGVAERNNNQNGPGSPSVRVYVKTLSTFGTHIPEIQEIETSAAPGQKLQGHFLVYYGGYIHPSRPIPYDAYAADVRSALETAFPQAGNLIVERDDSKQQIPEISRLWRITFATAVGNVPQFRVESRLTGLDSKVVSRTVRQGNELSGSIQLTLSGKQTPPLPHNISAEALRDAMLANFPFLVDARVQRTDASSHCLQGATRPDQTASNSVIAGEAEDMYQPLDWMLPNEYEQDRRSNAPSLCSCGRGAAGGFVWKLQFWTLQGIRRPNSPSSPGYLQSQPCDSMSVDASRLVGMGAAAQVLDSQCFSLAFGGAGAAHGGKGGDGYTQPAQNAALIAPVYSEAIVTDLVGGSGGAGGGQEPIDVFPVVQPTRGGAGGGAIFLGAENDVFIGPRGRIVVNGGQGSAGYTAGGGGSAGTILIECKGVVAHFGSLEAVGGHGGASWPSPTSGDTVAMSGGGGGGGRLGIFAQAFSTWSAGVIQVSGGASQDQRRVGAHGSSHIQVATSLGFRVDPSIGAAGTSKSLLIEASEAVQVPVIRNSVNDDQVPVRNGPQFRFAQPVKSERVSFFVRVGSIAQGRVTTNRGAIFGLHSSAMAIDNKNEYLIAVGILGGKFMHESNAFSLPRREFQAKAQPNRWYKVDIFLDWGQLTYSIHLNDVLKVAHADFVGSDLASVSLSNFHAMATWWDEIYVGDNYLKDFACPYVKQRGGSMTSAWSDVVVIRQRELRKLWAATTIGPETSFHPMTKHESHLSEREIYKHDNGHLVPFDGAPHRAFLNEIREVESEASDGTSDEDLQDSGEEVVSPAETLTLNNAAQDGSIVQPLETGQDFEALPADATDAQFLSRSHGPTIYWYSEYFNATTGEGAIGACSTLDYVEWRNEGIMLHFVNLTDPFANATTTPLLADRPQVLYNPQSQQFVMWMHIDNASNTMGLTGVATSSTPNGPFRMIQSFYPDAPLEAPGGQSINETHDQVVAVISSLAADVPDAAFLIRTYFKTVEYWLPRAVMDPLWQSVQKPDGTTDFALSYHRAVYHEGYDDPNDIYLQRWRMEDVPWEVECCETTNATNCELVTELPTNASDLCPSGMTKKKVLGQSQVADGEHVHTRYKDPHDDANSWFIPDSVASHTSWGFQVYNVKTWRGNYFDALSTNITEFVFHRFAGERRRREIEQDASIEFTYPNEDEQISKISTNDTEILNALLDTLGVPISTGFASKYSSFDLEEIDVNSDGKITSAEIAHIKTHLAQNDISASLITSMLRDYEIMKWDQVQAMDADADGWISLHEFEAWVGLDPNLMFDQFDLDKSGFLDENELARLLWYRQLPRIDIAMILLDPSFDGRVFYPRFRAQLKDAPEYMFDAYDFDKSSTLTDDEVTLMLKDLGVFAIPPALAGLKNPATKSISRADYTKWLRASTSLLGDARNQLKVDNAVHATRPDSLTGPMQVVERRRAKYVAISRLRDDYLATTGLLKEVEGDFEGREALLNFFSFAEDLFGLHTDHLDAVVHDDHAVQADTKPFRSFLSSSALGNRASYWNGRDWEGRPSAPTLFAYGAQCNQYAGVDTSDSGCLPCLTRSTFVTSTIEAYQSQTTTATHCQAFKEMDAYIKGFDQQVSIQLQHQQMSVYGPQGLQPHMSPCYNQTQFFPCDIHKVVDGMIANDLQDAMARDTPWNLAWEKHPNNRGSSVKIRADDEQPASLGPTLLERFPTRDREPLHGIEVDGESFLYPDEMADVLGGGN